MTYKIKLDGTTKDIFEIGLGKGVLDFSALTTSRLLKFPDSDGSSGYALTTDGAGNLSWAAGGSGSPGGADTNIQFNDGGVFGGDADFAWDKTSNILTHTGFQFLTGVQTNAMTFRNATGGNNSIWGIQSVSSTATTAPNVGLNRSRGSYASPTTLSSGDRLGSISFRGHNGTDFQTAGVIISDTTEAWTGSARGCNLSFVVTRRGTNTTTNALVMSHDNTNPFYVLGQNAIFRQTTTGTYYFNNSSTTTYATINPSVNGYGGATTDLIRYTDLTGGYSGTLAFSASTANALTLAAGAGVSGAGGYLSFTSGTGPDGSSGGDVTAYGADTGIGGRLVFTGGAAAAAAMGVGGDVEFNAGGADPTFAGTIGGLFNASGGNADRGGDVLFTGGAGETARGGHLLFNGGVSTSGTPGYIRFNTAGTERFKIDDTGAWQLATSAGTSGYVLTSNGAGTPPTWQASGGGGSPGGADTNIQFNDSGAFGGVSTFTWDKATWTMGLNGTTIEAAAPTAGQWTFTGRDQDQVTDPTFVPDSISFEAGAETSGGFAGATMNLAGGSLAAGGGLDGGAGSVSAPVMGDGSQGGAVNFNSGGGDISGNINFSVNPGLTTGGSINFNAGDAPDGGEILFTTGAGAVAGSLTFRVGNTDALVIDDGLDWKIGAAGDAGTSGQVLTSQGTGAEPIWATPSGGGAPSYDFITATAAQTVFNPSCSTVANGSGLAYLQVFVNGVKQREGGSYTVTGANQITFAAGLAVNDEVEFYAF
jgi:hypothetical protein